MLVRTIPGPCHPPRHDASRECATPLEDAMATGFTCFGMSRTTTPCEYTEDMSGHLLVLDTMDIGPCSCGQGFVSQPLLSSDANDEFRVLGRWVQ